MRPFVIIEQDPAAATELRGIVEAAGFRTECLANSIHALERLRKRAYSLAILDLDLRDTDPFAICSAASQVVPVITLAAQNDDDSCLRAFAAGADDHLVRPFTGRELVARIRNVLRRGDSTGSGLAASEIDSISVSIAEMRVRAGTETYDLTRGEAEVLSLLIEYAPFPLTVSRMTELLKTKRYTIESRIKSLRRKLGTGRLVTRGRFGYQIETASGSF